MYCEQSQSMSVIARAREEGESALNIYVASSWRNPYQQEVVAKLRDAGHQVYDFRGPGDGWGTAGEGPGGLVWSELDPDWKDWVNNVPAYILALTHPRAVEGFRRDMDALEKCDVCILVNPCGQSAHAEMGYAVGAGKLVAVYCPGIREPDLMVKMAGMVTDKWDMIEFWLRVPMEV
jgi:hypothetical protein